MNVVQVRYANFGCKLCHFLFSLFIATEQEEGGTVYTVRPMYVLQSCRRAGRK